MDQRLSIQKYSVTGNITFVERVQTNEFEKDFQIGAPLKNMHDMSHII